MSEQYGSVVLKRLNLLVTKRCNLRCRMCDYRLNNALTHEMSFDQIKTVIKDAKELGLEMLELSGGEPLVRKEIFEIIEFAHSLDVAVMMMTNGVLIDETVAAKLIDIGLTDVVISLEGFADINDQIRGKGNYKKAITAVQAFVQLRHKIKTVGVGITISRHNYQQLYTFIKYLAEEIGLTRISLNPFSGDMLYKTHYEERKDEFEMEPEMLPILKAELEKIIAYKDVTTCQLPYVTFLRKIPDYFEKKSMRPEKGCTQPLTSCGILAEGKVFPCWKTTSVGNVKDSSLKAIVAADKYLQYCELAINRKCSGCLSACYANVHEGEKSR